MPRKAKVNVDIDLMEETEPPATLKTRSGRVVKKPKKYEPSEKVLDDYSDSDEEAFSEEDDEGESILSSDEDDYEEEDEYASDADQHGNLKDFVVYSDEEDESDNEDE